MAVRLISRFLITFLIAAFFYCGLVWLAIEFDRVNWLPNYHTTAGGYGQMLLRMREAKNVQEADLLFIGSSHAYRGFDPREFKKKGYSTFNLGSTSQTPFNSYYLLKEYLPRIKPKVVVMDMYWRMLGIEATESAIDIVSNARPEDAFLEMAAKTKNGLVLNSLLINAILRSHTPLSQLKQEEIPDEVYVSGGYTQSLHQRNTLSRQQLKSLGTRQFKLSRLQQKYLLKIIALCKANQVRLVWVSTPVTQEYYSQVENYDDYLAAISALAARHTIPFIDYNQRDDLNLDTMRDFYDMDHLTQDGVLKFNQLLLQDLEKLKIPEHVLATN